MDKQAKRERRSLWLNVGPSGDDTSNLNETENPYCEVGP